MHLSSEDKQGLERVMCRSCCCVTPLWSLALQVIQGKLFNLSEPPFLHL